MTEKVLITLGMIALGIVLVVGLEEHINVDKRSTPLKIEARNYEPPETRVTYSTDSEGRISPDFDYIPERWILVITTDAGETFAQDVSKATWSKAAVGSHWHATSWHGRWLGIRTWLDLGTKDESRLSVEAE